jgi:hypothetical protein
MKRTLIIAAITAIAATSMSAETRVTRRQERQQARIAQGIRSGSLTPREAAALETKQAKLQAEKVDMREDNGGTLTARDKAILNRQQNRLSRNIYVEKHDAPKLH